MVASLGKSMNTKKMKTLLTFIKPTIICLTPVRNEAWILDRFLQATSLWADYIIIADQMSTDGSREIARKYPKVILVDNNTEEFNEPERQRLLISEARKIEGPRLLITLDADEIFTPNMLDSEEWNTMLTAEPGTIFKFQWANLRPDFKTFWYGYYFPWGYMDDGHEHTENNKIHSGRIPLPVNHPIVEIKDVKVMHFQFTDWKRMESKHRWYQCMEVINYPQKSAIEIYRQYHHMDVIDDSLLNQIPSEWMKFYERNGINLVVNKSDLFYWFDQNTIKYFIEHGLYCFRKVCIWDVNWTQISIHLEINNKFNDPRNLKDKFIHFWLKKTQTFQHKKIVRRFDRFLIYNLHY